MKKQITFQEAVEMMIEAKIIEGKMSVGTNAKMTEINIPAGGIDANKEGFFNRSDVCRLIGYAQMEGK